jgi:hypothetical protein
LFDSTLLEFLFGEDLVRVEFVETVVEVRDQLRSQVVSSSGRTRSNYAGLGDAAAA